MASSVELSECIAEQLGLPSATVLLHMRNIREAGILTQGGRGRSAAAMTAADAAHLLIASVASTGPKDSLSATKSYAAIPRARPTNWKPPLIAGIDRLAAQHTFVEAMTGLINSARSGDLRIRPPSDAIVVTVFWPWTSTKIEYFRPDQNRIKELLTRGLKAGEEFSEKPFRIHYGSGYILAPNMPPIPPPGFAEGDLQQERKFTHRTILQVAKCLGLPDP